MGYDCAHIRNHNAVWLNVMSCCRYILEHGTLILHVEGIHKLSFGNTAWKLK